MKEQESEQMDKFTTLQNVLRNYRLTPHTSTGLPPTEMMFQHPIRTEFDLMKSVTPLKTKSTTKYTVGDSVWALNYQSHRPHKWQQGSITKNLGSMLYEVRSSDGQYHKRHQQPTSS